jgi:hypothetical protein
MASEGPEWILPVVQVAAWFNRASAGERLIYAHGPTLVQGETSAYVRDLALAGKADPVQPRSPLGGFDYVIQKRSSPIEPPRGRREPQDEATETIYRAFASAAQQRARAPSNTELARRAGLATREQAAWRVKQLVQGERIRLASVTVGPDAGWRVVTIVATGRQTKLPPSWTNDAEAKARKVAQ